MRDSCSASAAALNGGTAAGEPTKVADAAADAEKAEAAEDADAAELSVAVGARAEALAGTGAGAKSDRGGTGASVMLSSLPYKGPHLDCGLNLDAPLSHAHSPLDRDADPASEIESSPSAAVARMQRSESSAYAIDAAVTSAAVKADDAEVKPPCSCSCCSCAK